MNKETEIKLRASAETLAALRDHPLLKKRNKSGWASKALYNAYYDTPERDLANARVALRLRRDGEQCIQTLKSRGRSVAGLSERNEWDWYLQDAALDLALLDDSCWPQSLATLDKTRLQPIFSTDFERQYAEIAWGRGKAKVVIEAALDQGKVVADGAEEVISELELELRQGDPAALLELAAQLAADLPLMPCDISKAERGYRLQAADAAQVLLPAVELDEETSVDDAFAALAWRLLGNAGRLAEQYRFSGQWKLLEQWLQQLIDLRAMLASLGQAGPRAASREVRNALDALLQDWRPRLQGGGQDENLRREAPALFAAELENTRWGRFSLDAAAWLHAGGWRVGRKPHGERMGAAPLVRWLPRVLAEEAQAFPLEALRHRPQQLGEQLPRLERMLAWLRQTRVTLPLPEADRLYGELAKLAELSIAGDDLTITAQLQQLSVLKPWKALQH